MKTYTYEQPYFSIEVLGTGLFCGALVALCVVGAVTNLFMPPALLALFAAVAFYQVWNTFVAIANPRRVTLGDEAISFAAFGRTDRFELGDVHEFRVREFPSAKKMYVRINGGGLLRGRYWLQTKVMTDGDELFRRLLDMEYKLHPDTIKARARRVNSEYLEHQDQLDRSRHAARSKRAKRVGKAGVSQPAHSNKSLSCVREEEGTPYV